jgi:hypothetical protein
VREVEYNEDDVRFSFIVQKTSFREAFTSKRIQFGQTSDVYYLRRHDRLLRRQTNSLVPSGVVASEASTAIPSDTPTPTVESVTFDLTNDQKDSTFSWSESIQSGPKAPLTVGCKECHTKGQMILTQGEIDIPSLDDLETQFHNANDLQLISSGFLQLELNGFASSILLKAVPSTAVGFAYNLFSVPIRGFKVINATLHLMIRV